MCCKQFNFDMLYHLVGLGSIEKRWPKSHRTGALSLSLSLCLSVPIPSLMKRLLLFLRLRPTTYSLCMHTLTERVRLHEPKEPTFTLDFSVQTSKRLSNWRTKKQENEATLSAATPTHYFSFSLSFICIKSLMIGKV